MRFPTPDAALTNILVVTDLVRSLEFYTGTLGAALEREYGGTSAVVSFNGAWILLVTGGPPTRDKPGVTFAPPINQDLVSHAMTIRVRDCRAAFETLLGRGADFLTPPVDSGSEVRCFFRDPDGHLIEISELRKR